MGRRVGRQALGARSRPGDGRGLGKRQRQLPRGLHAPTLAAARTLGELPFSEWIRRRWERPRRGGASAWGWRTPGPPPPASAASPRGLLGADRRARLGGAQARRERTRDSRPGPQDNGTTAATMMAGFTRRAQNGTGRYRTPRRAGRGV